MTKQPEAKVSTKIMKLWRDMGAFAYKVHGGPMQATGIPDISGTYKGWSVWCETKMPGNKPSKIQNYRINSIRAAGGLVVVAYCASDAVDMLKHIDAGNHSRMNCRCPYSSLIDLSAIGD